MSGIWEPRVLSLSKGGRLLSQQAPEVLVCVRRQAAYLPLAVDAPAGSGSGSVAMPRM